MEIIRRAPSSLVLDVVTPSDGLLVLSEVYYPGWRATVDGQPTSIARVNYVLRGVSVPAGQHRVEIFYRPKTFTWGAVISWITLAVLAAVSVWVWRRRKPTDE